MIGEKSNNQAISLIEKKYKYMLMKIAEENLSAFISPNLENEDIDTKRISEHINKLLSNGKK